MPIQNITTLPTPPTRQDPSNFADRGDAFLSALPTFVTELNTAGDNIEAAQTEAVTASEYAWEAVDAASLAAGTSVWVMGTTYAQYANAIDPIDYKNYRSNTSGISNTRPGVDTGRWVLLSSFGDVTTDTTQTITGGKTFTGPLELSKMNGLASVGFSRNKIVNGNMLFMQANLNPTNPANNDYTLDQWQINKLGAVTAQVSIGRIDEMSALGLSYPTPILSTRYCLRATVVTAQATLAAGNEMYAITQPLEGVTLTDFVSSPFTLSFWVKSDRAGVYCIALSGTNGYNIVREYTVNTVNTWEKKSITFDELNLAHLTWDFTISKSMTVKFILAAGSSYQDAAFGTWKSSSHLASPSQTNFLQTIGHKFQITAVQLEPGSQATPFEVNSYSFESERVRRYLRTNPSLTAYSVNTTNCTMFLGDFISNMRIALPAFSLVSGGTNALLDPGVAQRNITALGASNASYIDFTSATTTANKTHVIIDGTIYASARM